MKAPPRSHLVRELGRGSCFEVALVDWQGRAAIAKRPAAALPEADIDPPPIERERRVLSALAHPRLPQLLDAGADAGGRYVIESFFAGSSLRAAIDTSGAPPARGLLARQAVELLRVVHDAHVDGQPLAIVHGDLSPDSFIVGPGAELALIDFSAAGMAGPAGAFAAIGRGTLPYAAPELCRGEQTPSAATDRYALAALVLDLLVGQRLFEARPEPALLVEIGELGHEPRAQACAGIEPAVRQPLVDLLRFDPHARSADLEPLLRALTIRFAQSSGPA